MGPKVQILFYRCTIDSLLSSSFAIYCASCTTQDLHKVLWSDSECITESSLPNLQDNRTTLSETKANKIIKDPFRPNSSLFSLLQSEIAQQSLRVNPQRFRRSSCTQAIQTLNEDSARGLQHQQHSRDLDLAHMHFITHTHKHSHTLFYDCADAEHHKITIYFPFSEFTPQYFNTYLLPNYSFCLFLTWH